MFIIGLTGGIASGKSNVAKNLLELGAKVIDADILAHSVYTPNTSAYKQLVQTFGNDIIDEKDNSVKRNVLGAKVFGNPSNMKKLTDIVWPYTKEIAKNEIAKYKESNAQVVVLEAALFIESEWYKEVDELWVALVPPEVAKQRLMKRNNLSESDAITRINSQNKNEFRTPYANVIINTDNEFEITKKIVEKEWHQLLDRINSGQIKPRSTL